MTFAVISAVAFDPTLGGLIFFPVFSLSTTQVCQLERMDPSQAHQAMVQSEHLSVLESSASGVRSLIESLGRSQAWYTAILNAALEANNAEAVSLSLLTQPAWTSASSSVASTLTASVNTPYDTAVGTAQTHTTTALGLAATAQASTATASVELNLANDLAASATLLQTALDELATPSNLTPTHSSPASSASDPKSSSPPTLRPCPHPSSHPRA